MVHPAETAKRVLFSENGAVGVQEKSPIPGDPIIVVPPVGRSDMNMASMRDWINSQGHPAFDSGIEKGDIRDPRGDILRIIARIDEVFEETGREITMIGLSLAGIYVFVSAMYRPEKIRRVILIGTPIRRHIAEAAKGRYKEIAKAIINGNRSYDSFLSAIPITSMPFDYNLICMYTRDDEAFDWKDCSGDKRSNMDIEVDGPHRNLYRNPKVFEKITSVLKTPIDKAA
ncbi:MAG: hypothetical protein A2629_01910 [Candidatus Levybacteria bacterium RIFCSPHIGHO2_01_FULL_41_15]|nr:MAG: hypothetical protein A2629_01910 [Candidatus Levybacteria bacterium RIFCSPHIGHO2_01_FULL_41_15]